MIPSPHPFPRVAIACGGTGGHLFPGLAVGEQLRQYGAGVVLLVSPKQVDRQAIKDLRKIEVLTLPAVGLTRGRAGAFIRGFWQSYRAIKRAFASDLPQAVLAMGGFTGAPPVLAAKGMGARTFLHESNTIPGRANRWLSWLVDQAFVGFPETARHFARPPVLVTGTPVRSTFGPRDPAQCRAMLGLDPERPVVLVMGGSQGASAINQLILGALPQLASLASPWQWLHLTGPDEVSLVQQAYSRHKLTALVRPFLVEMDLALGAASAAVSRAGASSLAELAAMGVPAVLVPYPLATDNHQYQNARAFADSGAALLLPQQAATAEAVTKLLRDMMENTELRAAMRAALTSWHAPGAAQQIAGAILRSLGLAADRMEAAQEMVRSDRSGEALDNGKTNAQIHLKLA